MVMPPELHPTRLTDDQHDADARSAPRRGPETGDGDLVAVCIVTHDSAPDLPACLRSVAALRYRPLELIVADCASQDESVRLLREGLRGSLPTRILELDDNLGFAGGCNLAIREALAGAPTMCCC